MTTLNIADLYNSMLDTLVIRDCFEIWCSENKHTPLSRWLLENGYKSSDLYISGLIDYPVKGPISGIFNNEPYLTEIGKKYIDYPEFIESEFSYGVDFIYVIDSEGLCGVLAHLNDRTEKQKILDDAKEYKLKHGIDPKFPDEYLPFEERSYIAGPYCNLQAAIDLRLLDIKLEKNFCNWCGKCLYQSPSFQIADCSLCYQCSKLAYDKLDSAIDTLNMMLDKEAHDSVISHTEWRSNFISRMRSKGIIRRLSELILGDDGSYNENFRSANPEPTVIENRTAIPAIRKNECTYDDILVSRLWVLKRDAFSCQRCGVAYNARSSSKLEVHHVIPKARGGNDFSTNLITLCVTCHDSETWFEHVRAYKSGDEPNDISWDWFIQPDLLEKSVEDLVQLRDYYSYTKLPNYSVSFRY